MVPCRWDAFRTITPKFPNFLTAGSCGACDTVTCQIRLPFGLSGVKSAFPARVIKVDGFIARLSLHADGVAIGISIDFPKRQGRNGYPVGKGVG